MMNSFVAANPVKRSIFNFTSKLSKSDSSDSETSSFHLEFSKIKEEEFKASDLDKDKPQDENVSNNQGAFGSDKPRSPMVLKSFTSEFDPILKRRKFVKINGAKGEDTNQKP